MADVGSDAITQAEQMRQRAERTMSDIAMTAEEYDKFERNARDRDIYYDVVSEVGKSETDLGPEDHFRGGSSDGMQQRSEAPGYGEPREINSSESVLHELDESLMEMKAQRSPAQNEIGTDVPERGDEPYNPALDLEDGSEEVPVHEEEQKPSNEQEPIGKEPELSEEIGADGQDTPYDPAMDLGDDEPEPDKEPEEELIEEREEAPVSEKEELEAKELTEEELGDAEPSREDARGNDSYVRENEEPEEPVPDRKSEEPAQEELDAPREPEEDEKETEVKREQAPEKDTSEISEEKTEPEESREPSDKAPKKRESRKTESRQPLTKKTQERIAEARTKAGRDPQALTDRKVSEARDQKSLSEKIRARVFSSREKKAAEKSMNTISDISNDGINVMRQMIKNGSTKAVTVTAKKSRVSMALNIGSAVSKVHPVVYIAYTAVKTAIKMIVKRKQELGTSARAAVTSMKSQSENLKKIAGSAEKVVEHSAPVK